ncbi:uncharacterized protein HMPREF1541_03031 [Cyphellophora europaea CBS 101466]|uniref:ABC transporter n=1 Tax=Cyphellophora europaea (strain CBS 101466) TaxID=1220924 RepID=W2RX54_CYPE1|nr:uncharacterized protein HMPREF1541_03031 [Cyphellophora europaea CBS 101466]ETN41096.1 hypothetical protein HMPREF1541_03031 [Cyphellophora europaea CBS 101466]
MGCPIEVEDVFGPAVASTCHWGFDFTLLFEEIFFGIVPVVVLSVLIPLRLFQLYRRQPVFRPGVFYYIKIACHAANSTIQLVKLIFLVIPNFVPKTRASIATAALSFYISLLLLALSHFEHLRSVRPSALLSLYFGLSILFDTIRARTLWTIEGNLPFAVAFSVDLGFKLALFIFESLEKESGYRRATYETVSHETAGNVFTRGLFWWLNPLLWKGFRRILDVDQLPAIDNELSSPELQKRVWARWERLPHKTPGALVKLLFSEYKYSMFQGMLPRLALSGFTFAQPFLITRVVNFATDPVVRLDNQLGNGLIAATALIYIGLAVSNANAQHKTYRVITKLRATLVSLIYYKTLGVSIPTAQESSAVTLMSTDVERSGTGLRFMHEVWASPIDIGLAIYLLERQLGPAAAAPGVLFMLCSGAGLRVAASMGQRQKLWLESIERRIKATSDMLSSMKEVRMGGLQARMEDEIEKLRKEEIEISRKFKNALALIVCLSYTTAAMGPVFSFGIFSLLAKRNNTTPLTTEKGFTSLAVFSLLRTPMALILDSIAGLVASIGAMQRIGEYLAAESHLPAHRHHTSPSPPPPYDPMSFEKGDERYDPVPLKELQPNLDSPSNSPDPRVVLATKYSAGWEKDRGFIVQDLNFSVMRGSLTFIVGPVGCGKSTLLNAMLGETTVNSGDLHTTFDRAAFAGQSPWLISDTIRNNIVGTSVFEPVWYNQVIDACALRDDISSMAHGDQEIVDGGGSNLSGGQQARVGVARAVYSRQRVIIFDDVMSGLDARTESTLFTNLLGPEGLLRNDSITTIFATNAVHRLSAGDHVIALTADGKILEQGPYAELLKTKHGQSSPPESDGFEQASIKPVDTEVQGLIAKLSAQEVKGSQRRTGDLSVYQYYAKIVGWFNFLLFLSCGALFVFALVFPQYLVKWWAEQNAREPHSKLGLYLGSYFGLAWLAIFGLAAGCLQLVVRMMPRASTSFHTILLQTTLNAPLSLFSGSNVGDSVNRFSSDLQLIDMELPLALFNTSIEFLSSIANLIVIAISAKFIGAALPAVLVVFFFVQKFYLRTARQLRLLDIEAKGPLFSHFLETLSGIAAIRSYGAEADYEHRAMDKLDYSQKPNYLLYCVQRWLNLVLDFIVAGIAIVFIAIAVKTKGDIDPGLIGTALVGIVNFSVSIKALLENWTNLETSVGAVSRVRSFALETRSEHMPGENHPPPPNWPAEGNVTYHEITATWEGKDKPVIKELSLGVEPGKKLAICGRSGSGKSSLISALFRLLEPQLGAIIIDGVDLTTMPRQEIRGRLICVPQAPFLLTGSIRENVDPFHVATDEDVMYALRQVQMLEAIQSIGGLNATVDGDKMSVGQKQLICLARATLRPGSILVLDEATASLDFDTDEIVQKVIRTAFKHHTIIAIAHRLKTIVDYDHVAVISDGRLVEYGPPSRLLEDQSSRFAQLYRISAGHTKIERAKSLARARSLQRNASARSGLTIRSLSKNVHRPPPLNDDPSQDLGRSNSWTTEDGKGPPSLANLQTTNLDHDKAEQDLSAWPSYHDSRPNFPDDDDDDEGVSPLIAGTLSGPHSDFPVMPTFAISSAPNSATSDSHFTVRQQIDAAFMSYTNASSRAGAGTGTIGRGGGVGMGDYGRYGGLARLATMKREREKREMDRRWEERLGRFGSLNGRTEGEEVVEGEASGSQARYSVPDVDFD